MPRASRAGFKWLVLFWWGLHVTRWLYRVLERSVHTSLMRLGLGSDEDAARHDGTLAPPMSCSRLSQKYPRPRGLVNAGNLCFVTTILQCLASIPGFTDSFEQALLHARSVVQTEDTHKQLVVADVLVKLLKHVRCEHGEETLDRARTQELMRTFRAVTSRFTYLISRAASRQEQQDAEEYLSFMLEFLHALFKSSSSACVQKEESVHADDDEVAREHALVARLKHCDPTDPRSYKDAVVNLGHMRWTHFLREHASVITANFSSQTVRGSQCSRCATLTCHHEEERILSLAIASGRKEQTLVECLEQFRHVEALTDDNRVYCDGYCRTQTNRVTQVLLQHVPPVLVIRLQRFQHTSTRGGRVEKVATPVTFPCGSNERLDLTPNAFVRDDAKRLDFELTAARIRDEQRVTQWFRIDDEIVTAIDETQLRTETRTSAYLLFYVRRHH